ncbi:MAG: type IV pilus twitching motility protein PilT [Pseudomonadota bacterium]
MSAPEALSPTLSQLVAICRAASIAGASDVHLKAGCAPLQRVNGELSPISRLPPLDRDTIAKMAWEIMSKPQRESFKETNDADFSWAVPGIGRFRANVFRQRQQIGMVLRTIPPTVKTIAELGLPPVLRRLADEPRGLILVTGTTGSGKSTTLAAIVEEINQRRACHVVTIEDPIEFAFRDHMAIVNQREIGTDTASFPAALRAALRQDPDVILVGELRDLESLEIALSAAETGHLVLSTIHAMNAPETINRIVGFFPPHAQPQVRRQLGATLRAILSQRLVPTSAGGRIAAVEVMINTGSVYECIVDEARTKEIPDLVAEGHEQYGSQTFDQALFGYIEQQIISVPDAMRHATSPDNLSMRLSGIGRNA